MSIFVPYNYFILLRTAAEQRRAVVALRGLAGKTRVWRKRLGESCDEAQTVLSEAIARTESRFQESQSESLRVRDALERGNLDELIAERNRLATRLAARTHSDNKTSTISARDRDAKNKYKGSSE